MEVLKVVFLLSFHPHVLFTYAAPKKPNILLVVIDDYGFNDIGYHGSEISTPNMDRLASEGVKLENYYVQPICTPSRSQLMTGKYQIHTGLQHAVLDPAQRNGVPLSDPMIPEKLKQAGYKSHIVGKWHLGYYTEDYTPTRRGFDSFYGFYLGSQDYYTHRKCWNFKQDSPPVDDGNERLSRLRGASCGLDMRSDFSVVRSVNGTYSTDLFVDKVRQIVDDHDTKHPLFMYVPFQAVHQPLQAPQKYIDKYKHIANHNRRVYAGMVTAVDDGIQRIVDAYKQKGIWENTIMILSTDNGGQVKAGGNNWPLRGWKNTLWEGGVRGVGFITGPPLRHRRGAVSRDLIHISDWYPTVLGLAGVSTKDMQLDSHDVWRTISKGHPSPRTELLHNIDPRRRAAGPSAVRAGFDTSVRAAIRVGDWKLITGDPGPSRWVPPPHSMFQMDSSVERNDIDYRPTVLKAITDQFTIDEVYRAPVKIWLFNVVNDPEERRNLANAYPKIVDKLLHRMSSYNRTAVPCRYPKPDPAANPDLHGDVWTSWVREELDPFVVRK